jgi:hypothetical protein
LLPDAIDPVLAEIFKRRPVKTRRPQTALAVLTKAAHAKNSLGDASESVRDIYNCPMPPSTFNSTPVM